MTLYRVSSDSIAPTLRTGSQKIFGDLPMSVYGAPVLPVLGRYPMSIRYRVASDSMKPLLENGDVLEIKPRLLYHRGDVIAFHNGDRVSTKRIVAVGGDEVMLRRGMVFIDGIPLPQASIGDDGVLLETNGQVRYLVTSLPCMASDSPCRLVPRGSVWVLGDNRSDSRDSRFTGPVRLHDVIGVCAI